MHNPLYDNKNAIDSTTTDSSREWCAPFGRDSQFPPRIDSAKLTDMTHQGEANAW